ncbi:MAG: hypothetical protein ABSA08_09130 [Acidimicrobiales bacterium]
MAFADRAAPREIELILRATIRFHIGDRVLVGRDLGDRRVDHLAQTHQFGHRLLALFVKVRELRHRPGAVLFQLAELLASALLDLGFDLLSLAACGGENRLRFFGGLLAKLRQLDLSFLPERVRAFAGLLEDPLDVLANAVELERLGRSTLIFERAHPAVQLAQLANGGGELALGLRSAAQ